MGKTMIVKQGDTLRKHILFKYVGTDTPVDLTGVVGYSQLRAVPKGPLKAEGTVAIDASNGSIIVTYSASQTSELEAGDYGFDVRLESEGDVKTVYTKYVKIIDPYTELE